MSNGFNKSDIVDFFLVEASEHLQILNDGLMAVFFFLVGLELKREVLVGELANRRKLALPLFGAIGGKNWGETDDDVSRRALHEALNHPFNHRVVFCMHHRQRPMGARHRQNIPMTREVLT